ncbi:hypothetical protein [Nocardia sp. 348MFTsu5.1]|nr:hypothetical protein [Nocardia sp. 348MFTsu5.1]
MESPVEQTLSLLVGPRPQAVDMEVLVFGRRLPAPDVVVVDEDLRRLL